MKINLSNNTVREFPSFGNPPHPYVIGAEILAVDHYLFYFGGKTDETKTYLYAFDLNKNYWFVFHVKPDNHTVTFTSVTQHDFFNMYNKILGVTGTIGTEKDKSDLKKIYGVEIFKTPRHFIKEKEIQDEKVKIIEDKNATIFNNKEASENKEIKEENTLSVNNRNEDKIINNNIKSGEIKEPKEIIDEEEVKKKEKIEKYKLAEKIAKSSALKDVHSVQSVQKLLLRENVDEQAPLRITIIKENPLASCDGYMPNKLPFLRSLPLV